MPDQVIQEVIYLSYNSRRKILLEGKLSVFTPRKLKLVRLVIAKNSYIYTLQNSFVAKLNLGENLLSCLRYVLTNFDCGTFQ